MPNSLPPPTLKPDDSRAPRRPSSRREDRVPGASEVRAGRRHCGARSGRWGRPWPPLASRRGSLHWSRRWSCWPGAVPTARTGTSLHRGRSGCALRSRRCSPDRHPSTEGALAAAAHCGGYERRRCASRVLREGVRPPKDGRRLAPPVTPSVDPQASRVLEPGATALARGGVARPGEATQASAPGGLGLARQAAAC